MLCDLLLDNYLFSIWIFGYLFLMSQVVKTCSLSLYVYQRDLRIFSNLPYIHASRTRVLLLISSLGNRISAVDETLSVRRNTERLSATCFITTIKKDKGVESSCVLEHGLYKYIYVDTRYLHLYLLILKCCVWLESWLMPCFYFTHKKRYVCVWVMRCCWKS